MRADMLTDAHAHVDDAAFARDRADVLVRAKAAGVGRIINAGCDMASSARAIALAEQYDWVYAAVGIHPHDLAGVGEADFQQLQEWTRHPKVVAIGEIGLDYYRHITPVPAQQAVFRRQLALAREAGKPVIIHDRDAHGDIMDILRREGQGLTGMLHCFSGSWEMARAVLAQGFYLSFAGPVTFHNARRVVEVVQQAPLDRILVETDSPYLTPEPLRGRRNEPAYVRYVAEFIAALRGLSLAELAARTTANAAKLFGLSQPGG